MTLRVQLQSRDGDVDTEVQMGGAPRVDDDVAIGGGSHTVYAVEWQADAFRAGGPDVIVTLA